MDKDFEAWMNAIYKKPNLDKINGKYVNRLTQAKYESFKERTK